MVKTRVDSAGGDALTRPSRLKSPPDALARVNRLKGTPTPPKKNPQRVVPRKTVMSGGFKKNAVLDASQITDRRGERYSPLPLQIPDKFRKPTPGPAPVKKKTLTPMQMAVRKKKLV